MTKPDPNAGPYMTHGLSNKLTSLREQGTTGLDGRSREAREIVAWQQALVTDLGGPDAISTAQYELLEQAARSRLILRAIDGWLFEKLAKHGPNAVVHGRDRRLYPIVSERIRVADSLMRTLEKLGLERRSPPAPTLEAYVEEAYGAGPEAA